MLLFIMFKRSSKLQELRPWGKVNCDTLRDLVTFVQF